MPLYGAAAALMARAAVWSPGTSGPRVDPLAKLAAGKAAAKVKLRDVVLGSDRIVDVTWADWVDLDPGHAVYIIASKDDAATVRTRLGAEVGAASARVYEPNAVPYDVRLRTFDDGTTTKTVYAVMATPPMRLPNEPPPCGECSGAGNPGFYAGGCTCLPIDQAPGPTFKTR